MLPGKSGFDICRAIRAQSDVPILLVTAKKEDIDKIKGLGLGADDYIVKPFSPVELTARIKAHMQIHKTLKAGRKEEVISTGQLRIYPGSYRVYKGKNKLELTGWCATRQVDNEKNINFLYCPVCAGQYFYAANNRS